MFQHILVPIDGTTASIHALDQAVHIAVPESAAITTVCVIDARVRNEAHVYVPVDGVLRISAEVVSPEQAETTYSRWAERISSRARNLGSAAGVDVYTAVETGTPHREIIARSPRYDLLVMGPWNSSHSYPGPFLGGATFSHVVAHTHLPALAVPDVPRNIEVILAAYDGSHEATDALQLAATWARAWDLQLIVLTVQNDGDVAQLLLHEARQRALPVVPRLVAREGQPAAVIRSVASDLDCDVIALGVHADRFPLRHSLGSVADALLRSSGIPLLFSH